MAILCRANVLASLQLIAGSQGSATGVGNLIDLALCRLHRCFQLTAEWCISLNKRKREQANPNYYGRGNSPTQYHGLNTVTRPLNRDLHCRPFMLPCLSHGFAARDAFMCVIN